MAPKPIFNKQADNKSFGVIPSRVISRPDNQEGGEETEIAAHLSLLEEGGWGWIVVAASFLNLFILDGVVFTFGSLLPDIAKDFSQDDSLVALINSVTVALYFISGPLVSAFINRFGFRECVMTGSVICSFGLFASYFTTNFGTLCLFYGVITGMGSSLVNMSSSLIVGFYFEKLRSIAIAIASCGSSLGVMAFFPLNTYLISRSDWRVVTLLHSGMLGMVYFFGMTYRPLLSLTVVKTTDDPTRTVTYLPSLTEAGIALAASRTKVEGVLAPTATERLFSAISNANFPTAAAVVEQDRLSTVTQAGPSTGPPISKLTVTAISPQGGISQRHIKQVQSIISRSSVQDKKIKKNIELTINIEQPKKRGCFARLFHWDHHVPQSRPMYRDDAFYHGKLKDLPVYQKSVMEISPEAKTGLEYQMAVSRAATSHDLREQRGVFTTAVRRVLATMMDPTLLKKISFLLLCANGFLNYLGFLVPYVFLHDRNLKAGIDANHCALFISVIGISTAIGRLCLGSLAVKLNPVRLYAFSSTVAGVSTILSNVSYNLYYQYIYCVIFGIFISGIACLRSIMIVDLYGLDKLTNATGMLMMFQGIGSLISTPLAGVIKKSYGYSAAFYVSGSFITLSGFIVMPVNRIIKHERLKEMNDRRGVRK